MGSREDKGYGLIVALGDLLSERRGEILRIWTASIRRLSPESAEATTSELIDHLPRIVDELTDLLRTPGEERVVPDRASTSGRHGVQRYRLGFVVEAVVREYGLLHRCVLDVVRDQNMTV